MLLSGDIEVVNTFFFFLLIRYFIASLLFLNYW